jgi:peptide deformylase
MKQRRLIVTPTIDYYQVEVEDETCLALRKYKDYVTRFVRVTFANEMQTRGFYQQHIDGG